MNKAELSREKLFRCKIQGQSKPFVDQNLQIQIPGLESSSIYSYYSSAEPNLNYLQPPFSPEEFQVAMQEARQSHEDWRKMEQQLRQLSISNRR